MLNVRRTLQMTSLMFGMVILFCYIGWHLGYEGFIIVGDIEIPYALQFIITSLLLLLNRSLYAGAILKEFNWKVLLYSLPIVCLGHIRRIFFPWIPSFIVTGILPMASILLICLFRTEFKKIISFNIPIMKKNVTFNINEGIIRLLVIDSITILYQYIMSKITCTPLTNRVSIYTILRLSIDGNLLMLLFYSLGGVKHHGRLGLERLVFPGRIRDARNCNEVCKDESKSDIDGPVNNFEKWVMRSVIGAAQVLQWMFILWVCNLDNLFLDALVMTTSFICHGMIISKRQHLKPIILCTLAATAMFYFAARFTISVTYSQFFPIIIGLILAYTVYRVSYQLELTSKEKAEKDLERIKALERKVENAWKRLDELSQ